MGMIGKGCDLFVSVWKSVYWLEWLDSMIKAPARCWPREERENRFFPDARLKECFLFPSLPLVSQCRRTTVNAKVYNNDLWLNLDNMLFNWKEALWLFDLLLITNHNASWLGQSVEFWISRCPHQLNKFIFCPHLQSVPSKWKPNLSVLVPSQQHESIHTTTRSICNLSKLSLMYPM